MIRPGTEGIAEMKAIMLAAGIGRRLTGDDGSGVPKSLLRFGGTTLLERHIRILRDADIPGLALVIGYRADDVEAEIAACGAAGFVTPVLNPDFRAGSMLSLWCAREHLRTGDGVLFMDADVLYDPAIIGLLIASAHPDCVPYDRDFEPGDEPVKLCLRDGRAVEFRKEVDPHLIYETVGEWPGFAKLSPDGARRVADILDARVQAGRTEEPYEESLREAMLENDGARFGTLDVTGLPWIEIDFPEDVVRAEMEILPLLPALAAR
jgi:choline kinase